MVNTSSLANRILSHMSNYRRMGSGSPWPDFVDEVALSSDKEKLLGIYENYHNTQRDIIIVTNLGLILNQSTGWGYIEYTQIEKVNAEFESNAESSFGKSFVEGLSLQMKNGTSIWLPIVGGNDKFRDAFEFMRFLDRVTKKVLLTQ